MFVAMSCNVVVVPESAEQAANKDVANTENQLVMTSKKLRAAFLYNFIDNYICFGKPKSINAGQYKAATQYDRTSRLHLDHSTTVPWDWPEHNYTTMLMIREAGFEPQHLLIVEFVNEVDPKVKKTLTFYSYEDCELFSNLPTDFKTFCKKLDEVCAEMALSQPESGKVQQRLAMFDYCIGSHKALDFSQADVDAKSALISLLRKLGVVQGDSLCRVQALDPFQPYPDIEFQQRHWKFRPLVSDYLQKLLDQKNWLTSPDEHDTFLRQISTTFQADEEFRKVVNKFATKYLKE